MSTYSQELPRNLYISLKSIFRNTLLPAEVVLVKDGPLTAELDRVIDNFQSNYQILKVFELKTNQGTAIATNFAISKSNNNWIIKQDSDDFSHRDRFQLLMSNIKNDPIFFGSYMVERYGRYRKIKKVPLSNKIIKESIIYRNPFNNPTMCFHKDLFNDLDGVPNVKYKEDWAFWIMSIKKYNCFNINKILVTSMNSTGMISRRQGYHNILSEFHIQKLCIEENLSSIWRSIYVYFIRVSMLLLPKRLLEKIYLYLLRSNYKK